MTSWLHQQRLEAVLTVIRERGSRTVLDLGCGDGDLLVRLVCEPQIKRVVGLDKSFEALADLRARLSCLPNGLHAKADLVQGSMTRAYSGLTDFDAAVLVEAIEHLEPDRLSALEAVVFRAMRPSTVVMTTPNADYNPLLGVPGHSFRHPDHRFEWGRGKFRSWVRGVAARNGYDVHCLDLAGEHPVHGGASQLAQFHRKDKERIAA